MGQAAGCSEVAKAPPKEGAASTTSAPGFPTKAAETEAEAVAALAAGRTGAQNGHAASGKDAEFTEADILRFSETPEIRRLREELMAKEKSLQLLQKEACGHLSLIETLEREAYQKDEAINRLRASESAQREVAGLVVKLRERENDIDKLRRRAATEEATLQALTVEARTKGDVVEDLVCAITEQAKSQGQVPVINPISPSASNGRPALQDNARDLGSQSAVSNALAAREAGFDENMSLKAKLSLIAGQKPGTFRDDSRP